MCVHAQGRRFSRCILGASEAKSASEGFERGLAIADGELESAEIGLGDRKLAFDERVL